MANPRSSRVTQAGYIIRQSRRQIDGLNNRGEFMLVDAEKHFPVLGFKYDATLDDIAAWIDGDCRHDRSSHAGSPSQAPQRIGERG
jgi:hypothetical protein